MTRRKPRVTTTLLARRTSALKRHLAGAVVGEGRSVHQARVASRRLREALPVLAAGVKGSQAGKARRKIRRLTKALGVLRELDVTLSVVDELAGRDTLPRLALEEVRRRVVSERDERRDVMLKRLGQINLSKLDRRLAPVRAALAGADAEGWRDALGSRLIKRSRAFDAAMAEAGRIYAPDRLHQVRIAAKKLRYAMELASDAGVKPAAAPLRVLKRTQDALGRLHDLQVLQSHVAAVQAEAPGRTIPEGGLDIINRVLEDECRHLHARYVAAIPQLTEVIGITRTAVVPQLAHRARGKSRALKMALKDRSHTARALTRPMLAAVNQRT